MLADVIEMPGSPLPTVHLEAQEDSLGTVLLSRGTFVFEGNGESLELSLILAFAHLTMTFHTMALFEACLAATAHEDAIFGLNMAPLMLARLLRRMSHALLSSDRCFHDRSICIYLIMHSRYAYMMVPSSSEEDD